MVLRKLNSNRSFPETFLCICLRGKSHWDMSLKWEACKTIALYLACTPPFWHPHGFFWRVSRYWFKAQSYIGQHKQATYSPRYPRCICLDCLGVLLVDAPVATCLWKIESKEMSLVLVGEMWKSLIQWLSTILYSLKKVEIAPLLKGNFAIFQPILSFVRV